MIIDEFLITFILIILYIICLFILKEIGWKKKQTCEKCNNCCPDCQKALNRIQRKSSDHLINYLTLRIFDPRRYICSNCGWEGLKWEDKFKPKTN